MASERLAFLNPTATPAKPPGLIDNFAAAFKKVSGLAIFFAAVTTAVAALYYIGSPRGWGIRSTFQSSAAALRPQSSETASASTDIRFLDCLYFSIVTITTLGYGDFRPVSYGRMLASAEAITGIVAMGIFISRLVSRQQDRLTKRLVSGQLNSEIQRFRQHIGDLFQALSRPHPELSLHQKSQWLHDAGALAKSIASYWRHEALLADLVEVIPTRAVSRLLADLTDMMNWIRVSLDIRTRTDLHPADLTAIRRVAESALTVATVLVDRVGGESTKHSYARVAKLVSHFRTQLEFVPKATKSTTRSRRRQRRQHLQ